jgi:hypothetical protein
MSVAFHEAFWTVTGAAAPVLGLAAVLSVSDLDRTVAQLAKLPAKDFKKYEATFDADDKFAKLYLKHGHRQIWQIRATKGIEYLQLTNIVGQAALLLASLGSIASQQNDIPLGTATAIAYVGLFLLALAGLVTVSFRQSERKFQYQAGKAQEALAAPRDGHEPTRSPDEPGRT